MVVVLQNKKKLKSLKEVLCHKELMVSNVVFDRQFGRGASGVNKSVGSGL